ncbi:C39 family peptidase [Streptomyces sp. P38-E01]|uniref:C39 family peptidase n=1 Tax=Streptomyces tardus TaxID=2780544 RepID=A0A949NAV7_9ACTN|nr:C39 family peptidase [Streptomyces tardus]MBU7600243.1 C39 family peptidase [Streptomyces tardus]
MSRTSATRRTVLTAALAAAAGLGAASAASASGARLPAGARTPAGLAGPAARNAAEESTVSYHAWTTAADWATGTGEGTRVDAVKRAGIVIDSAQGTVEYEDPHGGTETTSWEYARWTGPVTELDTPATELIASWNARTPEGSWVRTEVQGTYTDGETTPWYTLGVWASGDGSDVPRRTSVDDQGDDRTSVWTDTVSVDDTEAGPLLAAFQLRLTLLRTPGSDATPTVWRGGVMASAVPERFEVPASEPGEASGVELDVPTYSQNVHVGRYPEYDNGGEAWCSPTSSQMIIEYWGRGPSEEDLAWVEPEYDDPQVCHAARQTFDYQYQGCGNWPFNAAYAATYRDMQGIVLRLDSLADVEHLIRAGIPLITSQSFLAEELDGAGYGTAGHLMTVVGFTEDGDVIANDPAGSDNSDVRHVYKRRQWENIWLRTKRYNAEGKEASGSGGVCYIYLPAKPSAVQRRALKDLGIR